MRRKAISIFLVSVLLLLRLNLPAIGCCEGSPPGNPLCYKCQDGVWVLEDCAECGHDLDCTYGGEGCETCVDCICQDDDTKCPGRCHDCSGGSCIDDDTKCTGCCKCSGGNCVDENDNCSSVERCENCVCMCNNCYEWEDVFSNSYAPCPECDNSQGGCYSSDYWIQNNYAYFTGGIPPEGDIGLCDNPTKKEIVGYHIFCTDYDTDVDRIVEIVIKLGLDLSTYVDCGKCVLTESPSACLKCIVGLIVGEIVDELPCIFVDVCEHCYDWDENCSFPIEIDVVDWEKRQQEDIPFCIPGTNWP